MDEYEELEQEIEKYYNMYIEKFRNLDYLEHQLDTYNKKEIEKRKENQKALKKIQEKYKIEEFKIINEGNEDDNIMNEMGSTRTGFNNATMWWATSKETMTRTKMENPLAWAQRLTRWTKRALTRTSTFLN